MINVFGIATAILSIPAMMAALLAAIRSYRDRTAISARVSTSTASFAAVLVVINAALCAMNGLSPWITTPMAASSVVFVAMAWTAYQTAAERDRTGR
jgi:hypothetical protein